MKKLRKLLDVRNVIRTLVVHNEFKMIIWTIIASLLVGLFFGYTILKIVLSDEQTTKANIQTTNEQKENEIFNQVTLPGFSFFVVQAGVFSNKDNATDFGEEIEEIKLSHVVRQAEEQYFVWLSILPDENSANKWVKSIKKKKIDVIIKPWDIPSATIELREKEEEWLVTFTELLSDAIQTNEVDRQKFQQVVAQENEISTFKKWYEELQMIISQENLSSEQLLLQIIVHYEKFKKD